MRFFKKMGCARNDLEFTFLKEREDFAIPAENGLIPATDD
jgi:hypothetical protein